jgi:hypothetical protein
MEASVRWKCQPAPTRQQPHTPGMDEPVYAEHYARIWMAAATLSEVVRQVAHDLAVPISAGEVLLMAQRLRRDGVDLPSRPGMVKLEPLHLIRQPDGDYQDGHGRTAYRVGPDTPVEGPWVCSRCRGSMCHGFILLPTHLEEHWPVCDQCVCVTH